MKNKDKLVICQWCANNDETCSACGVCEKGEYFVPKGMDCASECGGCNCEQSFGTDNMGYAVGIDSIAKDQQYRKESIVSKRGDKIDEIVEAHWNYVECVIESGADVNKMFTFDEVMKIRKWDYCSAARHFYGHGYEDGKADIDAE